jgi:ATP-dependent DNA helicase RecG
MIAARGGCQSKWELEWNENVTLEDIDFDEVKRTAHIAVSEGRLSQDVDINDPKDLLRRFGLLKGEQPLNGAMAVFGKNLTFYPHCILKMAWFKGKDKTTFLDNRLVSGNIIELQSEAMAFCFKHLNLSGVVKGLYREEELEVPVEALREAIINALAHRLYSSNGGVSLAIFEDRVEISNPGNFSLDAASQRVEPGMASNPRNPLIARVLYLRKAIEMWGRGIGLIINACEKAHLAPPRIYEDRGFVYTVFTRPTKQEWSANVSAKNCATAFFRFKVFWGSLCLWYNCGCFEHRSAFFPSRLFCGVCSLGGGGCRGGVRCCAKGCGEHGRVHPRCLLRRPA